MPEGEEYKDYFPQERFKIEAPKDPAEIESRPPEFPPDTAVEEPTTSLESVNIRRNLPIDWPALENLSRSVNQLKELPFTRNDILGLKPPSSASFAIPMIASVIAKEAGEEVAVSLPNKEQIKAVKPWLRKISSVISKFSASLSDKFDRYLERKGANFIESIGLTVYNSAEKIGQIEKPKDRFIVEVSRLYENMVGANPDYPSATIEERIGHLLQTMREVRYGRIKYTAPGKLLWFRVDYEYNTDYNKMCRWFNPNNFPFLFKLLPIIKVPPDSLVSNPNTSLAAAEMMEGIELYLKGEKVPEVKSAPQPTRFDLLNWDTWTFPAVKRTFFAEIFAQGQLEKVKREIPNILYQTRRVLPESGPDFFKSVTTIARNVCLLKEQGYSDQELVEGLFRKATLTKSLEV